MRLREHKYHAKATVVDGIRFASQKEARRFQELKLLEKAGEISCLGTQPVFVLRAPGFRGEMCQEDIGKYVGDFCYFDARTGEEVIEDVKGFKTPLYKWKKKHVMAQYGIIIKEV